MRIVSHRYPDWALIYLGGSISTGTKKKQISTTNLQ